MERIKQKRERAYERWKLLSPIVKLTEDGRTVGQRAFDWLMVWDCLYHEAIRKGES